MAVFRNVSGVDRQLGLPELGQILEVDDGATVDVPDEIALAYDFSQGGVWEVVTAPAGAPSAEPTEPTEQTEQTEPAEPAEQTEQAELEEGAR